MAVIVRIYLLFHVTQTATLTGLVQAAGMGQEQ